MKYLLKNQILILKKFFRRIRSTFFYKYTITFQRFLISLVEKYYVNHLSDLAFKIFFNYTSWIYNSPDRIDIYKKGYYVFRKKNWIFCNKHFGLHSYKLGLKWRFEWMKNSYLLNDIKFNELDNIIDCGANNGDLFPVFDCDINYYGFEPSPKIFNCLRFNIKNQNVYKKILSNQTNNDINLYVSDDMGDSSGLEFPNFKFMIKAESETLDNLIDSIKGDVKLIKIEAEGMEPEVLYGLKRNLNKVLYITIDCSAERWNRSIQRFTTTISSCTNYLIKNDFELIKCGNLNKIALLFKNKNSAKKK